MSLSLAACSDDSSTTSDARPALCDTTQEVQEALLVPRCTNAGCHAGPVPAADLDLAAPGLEDRLVGGSSSECAAQVLIVPGDAEGSYLYRKVADATPACGQRMPLGSVLSADELACVRTWIDGLVAPPPIDAAPVDAEPIDAAPVDAAPIDAEPIDAAPIDATAIDASPDDPDAAPPDAAPVDAAPPDAAPPDAAPPDAFSCPTGQTDCNGVCVDTDIDEQNCGACGSVCAASEVCEAGACTCGPTVSFSTQVQPIFNASCTGGACHDAVSPAAGLNLTAGSSYNELVNADIVQCISGKLVTPSSVANSYLVNKLTGVGMCLGLRMPRGAAALPVAQIDTIRRWICHGAPNN